MSPTQTGKAKTTTPPTGTFGDGEEAAVELHNKYLALVEDVQAMDPAQVSAQIAARILDADTVDDVLGMADSSATGARDIVGRPFVIMERPTWHKAKDSFSDGSGFFVVLTLGMQDTNDVLTVTCGGSNVLAQLYTMQAKGMLPNDVPMQFVSKATSRYDVLWLAKAAQK